MIPSTKNIYEKQDWSSFYWLIENLLLELQEGRRNAFSIQFLIPGEQSFPYLQGQLGYASEFQLEIVGEYFLRREMSRAQKASLEVLGWIPPDEEFENFRKYVDPAVPLSTASAYILNSVKLIFNIEHSVWMTIGTSPISKALVDTDRLWHHKDDPLVFCLPGENFDKTIEGTSKRFAESPENTTTVSQAKGS
jgi:hypothetical protein